jgi:hypothetical protein
MALFQNVDAMVFGFKYCQPTNQSLTYLNSRVIRMSSEENAHCLGSQVRLPSKQRISISAV